MNQVAHDPWIVQAPKQTAQVPVGFYTAAYKGVEEVTLPDGSAKWRFAWEVKTGPCSGQIASALTDQAINPNTHSGRLIAGLLGRAIVPGESVKAALEACQGQTYLVSVQAGPQGGKPAVRSVGKPPPM